ncbi:MAG: tetratricopeptide repeat protein [Candidatus Anammoxibacter sp.]
MKILRYCDQIIVAVLIFLIFALPIFFDVRLNSTFDLGKVGMMLFFGLIIMSLWLIRIIYTNKFEFPSTPLNLPVLAYIVITIIATIFSINPYMSLMGGYKRYEGLIETCTYIFIFFAIIRFINTERRLHLVINVIVFTAVITSLYGFMQYFGHDPYLWSMSSRSRVFSTFGNPVFFSAFLITTLPLSLALYLGYQRTEDGKQKTENRGQGADSRKKEIGNRQRIKRERLAKDIGYGICCLLIYSIFWHTKTRACFISLIVILPLFILFLGKERVYANKWKLSIIIAIFVIIGVFYGTSQRYSVFSRFTSQIKLFDKKDKTFDALKSTARETVDINEPDRKSDITKVISGSFLNRFYQYKTGLKIFNHYPVLGIGPDTLGIVYQRYLAKVSKNKKQNKWWSIQNRIHNDVLDNLVAKGVLGLIVYSWLILAYFWLVWKFLKAESLSTTNSGAVNSRLKAQSSKLTIKSSNYNCQSLTDKRLLVVSFGSGIIGYLVQNEFSFGNTPIVALFWTILGLTIVVICNPAPALPPVKKRKLLAGRDPQYRLRNVFLTMLVLSLTIFLAIVIRGWYKADIHMKKGVDLCNAGDLENGQEYFERAILRNPFEIRYQDFMIDALFKLGSKTKQKVWLERGINVAYNELKFIPQHYIAFLALGTAYDQLAKDFGEETTDIAIKYYKKSLESNPFQPELSGLLANLYIGKGMPDDASAILEKSIKTNFYKRKLKIEHVDQLARIYLPQNKLVKLQKLYNEVPRRFKSDASFCETKGLFYLKTKQYKDAIFEFQKALEINQTNAELYNNLGIAYVKIRLYDEAILEIKKALAIEPDNIGFLQSIAEIYYKQKRFIKAEDTLNYILKIDKENEKAMKLLAQLKH